jgi:hypothetical protein
VAERSGKNGSYQKSKAGKKTARKNVFRIAKVPKMAPVAQIRVFVPLEL